MSPPSTSNKIAVELEIGHIAALKAKKDPDNFTHNWELYVKGPNNNNISHFIDKIGIILHESFVKPRRTLKEPPYVLKESGYAGFQLIIDIYFKNRQTKTCRYDLDLQQSGPPVQRSIIQTFTFDNPPEEFRQKLLKGGGTCILTEEKPKDSSDRNNKQQLHDSKSKHSGINDTSSSKKHKNKVERNKIETTFHNLFGTPITKSFTQPTVPPTSSSSTVNISKTAASESKTVSSSSGNKNIVNSGIFSKSSTILPSPLSLPSNKTDKHSSLSSSSKDKTEKSDKRDKHNKHNSPHKEKNIAITNSATDIKDINSNSNSIKKDHKKQRDDHKKDKSHSKERERSKEKSSSSKRSLSPSTQQKTRIPSPQPVKKLLSSPTRSSSVTSNKDIKDVKTGSYSNIINDDKKSKNTTLKKSKKDKKSHDKDKERKDERKTNDKPKLEDNSGIDTNKNRDSHSRTSNASSNSTTSELSKDPNKSKELVVSSEKVSTSKKKDDKPLQISSESIPSTSKTKSEKPPDKSDDKYKHKHKKKDKSKEKESSSKEFSKNKKKDRTSRHNKDDQNRKAKDITPSTSATAQKTNLLPQSNNAQKTNSNSAARDETSTDSDSGSENPPPSTSTTVTSFTGTGEKPVLAQSDSSNISYSDASKKSLTQKKDRKKDTKKHEKREEKKRKRKNRDSSVDSVDKKSPKASTSSKEPATKLLRKNISTKNADFKTPVSQESSNTNNNNMAFTRNTDYMSELRELQKKIMTLQDNSDLQQVVELIAATGRYEITSKTFDFDLCALDLNTVQALKAFFASAATSVS